MEEQLAVIIAHLLDAQETLNKYEDILISINRDNFHLTKIGFKKLCEGADVNAKWNGDRIEMSAVVKDIKYFALF